MGNTTYINPNSIGTVISGDLTVDQLITEGTTDWSAPAGEDLIVSLGDSAGVNQWGVSALDTTARFTIDSVGVLTQNATLVAGDTAFSGLYATSGTAVGQIIGHTITLSAGYTGASITSAMAFDNIVAGTDTTYVTDATFGSRPGGNRGMGGFSRGTTTGVNTGLMGLARGGVQNWGGWLASTQAQVNKSNIGAIGIGFNDSVGGEGIGIYALYDDPAVVPNIAADTKTALLADNGNNAVNVAIFRAAQTDVFIMDDLGQNVLTPVTIGDGDAVSGDGAIKITHVLNDTTTTDGTAGAYAMIQGAITQTDSSAYSDVSYIEFGGSGTEVFSVDSAGNTLLAATAAIDWGDGDVTLTGGTNLLTLAGGQLFMNGSSTSLRFSDTSVGLLFGDQTDIGLTYNSTIDAFTVGLASESTTMVLTTKTNITKNHDHGILTNPTLFVHSSTDPDTANDEWISFTHDITNGVIETGSGNLYLNPVGGAVLIDPNVTAASLAMLGNASTGVQTFSMGGSGGAETSIRCDLSSDQFVFSSRSSTGTQFVFTEQSNASKNHDHADQTNPTIFVQSATDPDSDNTEYTYITHNTDIGVISAPNGISIPALKEGSYNIGLAAATTTTANDSIKITGSTAALSATNPGYVVIADVTSGLLKTFEVTSDVTIDLTGAHWGIGTTGDITDAILRVLALNNNGSLVWGIAYQGGRQIILDTLDSATGTDINLPEEVLVNSVLSADAQALETGWFKANFDDTGGASEDIWAVQSADGDLNLGSADGQWQPFNTTFTGFSVDPTITSQRFMQVGSTVTIMTEQGTGTSNATGFTMTAPIKSKQQSRQSLAVLTDNGSEAYGAGSIRTTSSSTTLTLSTAAGESSWTGSSTKRAFFTMSYESL